MEKEYLGDSVYVSPAIGGGLSLTTENGLPSDPSNEIFLEPPVAVALKKYIDRMIAEGEAIKAKLSRG